MPDGPDLMGEHEVAAFLRANPTFLAERPGLYEMLAPPRRVYGEHVADHMAAMIRAARREAEQHLSARRVMRSLTQTVHDAVIALLEAADVRAFVAAELPARLGIDAASLWVGGPVPAMVTARAASMAAGGQSAGDRSVLFRDAPADARLLYGAAAELARCDALIRLPVGSGGGSLLALAARSREALPVSGRDAYRFLARAIAAVLARQAEEA